MQRMMQIRKRFIRLNEKICGLNAFIWTSLAYNNTAISSTIAQHWSNLYIHEENVTGETSTNKDNKEWVKWTGENSLIHTRKLICKDGKARQPEKRQFREYERGRKWFVIADTVTKWWVVSEWSFLPSRSAPSSTSATMWSPADNSSSKRDSVLRSNARFSMPPLAGVLHGQIRQGEEGKMTIMMMKLWYCGIFI